MSKFQEALLKKDYPKTLAWILDIAEFLRKESNESEEINLGFRVSLGSFLLMSGMEEYLEKGGDDRIIEAPKNRKYWEATGSMLKIIPEILAQMVVSDFVQSNKP